MRQPRAKQQQRQAVLIDRVHAANQRRQLVAGNVLQLVDEQGDRPLDLARGLRGGNQHVFHVRLEITTVRVPRFRVHTEGHVDPARAHGYLSDEAAQHAQPALDRLDRLPRPIQLQQQPAQGVDQELAQVLAIPRLDLLHQIAAQLRRPADFIQQHRLAHATQAQNHQGLGVPTTLRAFKRRHRLFQHVGSASQLGRAHAGAGIERIAVGIHGRPAMTTNV